MIKRNIGIDLLRALAMFGIVSLHLLGQGGIIHNLTPSSANYYIFWIIEILCMCSVNVFGIITGYMYIKKEKYNSKRIIDLLITVIIYCLIITVIFYAFNICDIRNYGIQEFIKGIFPPIVQGYWYITCYTLLFFLIPYINKLLISITKKEHMTIIAILFIAFSIISTFLTKDAFRIQYGYSPFWLIFCYIIGAYIKLYDIKDKKFYLIIVNIIFILITVLLGNYIGIFKNISTKLMAYSSPLILFNSIYIFKIFDNLKISKFEKIIKYLSNTSFGVYILHGHILIYYHILQDVFPKYFNMTSWSFVLYYILILLAIYIVCSLIDHLKQQIFKLKTPNKINDFISVKINRLLNY